MIERVLGRYRVFEKLGEGGMGVVYRAHDETLGRDVVLKVLPEHVVSDRAARERLVREARTASALNHPHICTIHEVGEADGQTFIAMEHVEGRPLSALIGPEGLPAESVIRYGIQIADGVEHAHQRGIVHRDLKPSNVMITPEGRAKILDFGLARHLERELTEATVSEADAGTVVGTLPYMAPEVLQGTAADARSDVWSLGVTLYEMAAGARPFRGQTGFELTSAILRDPLRPLPASVPAGLSAVVRRCLAKAPGERYQRAGEVRASLETLQSGAHVPSPAPLPASRSSRRRLLGAVAAVALVVVAVLAWGVRDRFFGPAAPRIRSLAVLPLENLSGNPEQEYFSDGMTEALIAELSNIRALKVISRTSVMQFKGTKKPMPPMPEIAAELGVDGVIEGSVLREGNQVRITVQLIYGPTDRHLWAESYQRELRDILALQSDVARDVARQIKIAVTPEEQARLATARTVDPQAHEAYLKGEYYWTTFTTAGLLRAIDYFKESIRTDPSYAPPYAGLAQAYNTLSYFGGLAPRAAQPLAKQAALKALDLDDSLALAHVALGWTRLFYDWDWAGAEKELQTAVRLSPSAGSTHYAYGVYLSQMGRFTEAATEIERARELDPLSLQVNGALGATFLRLGQYDRAIEQVRTNLEIEPRFAMSHWLLGRIYRQKGRPDEAIAELQQAVRLSGGATFMKAWLAYSYAVTGRKRDARTVLAELTRSADSTYEPPSALALVYVGLGDKDRAFAMLEKAYEVRDGELPSLRTWPEFQPLRSDPRYLDLMHRLNLPPLPAVR